MGNQLKTFPTAYGSRNQVVVVADDEVWKSAIGDSIRYYYSSAYPILPQPEPIFDLTHYTPEELEEDQFKKQLRNYLIVGDLQNMDSPTTQFILKNLGEEKVKSVKADQNNSTAVGTDKWAKGQLLVFLYSDDETLLKEQIINTFPAIKKRIDQANRSKIIATLYVNGENNIIIKEMQDAMQVKMRVAKRVFTALNEENTYWIRRETPVSSSNIMIFKTPYKSQSQLSRPYLKAVQDSLGKKLVSSELEGTYMQINDIDLPMLTEVTSLNGNYALEARGIWEIVNDYMGGAFVSYLTVNPKNSQLLFINAFVHAPGEDKREFVQDLEYIVSTLEF
ncbi:MAG: DUF4837 family protein [Saprospiraceae bacterium]|nr:DUF4837 family protein [Saprospiraceae bacterium]